MNYTINVSDQAFEYLRIQKGNLDKHANNFPKWREFYEADIRKTFDAIAPFLPPGDPHRVLQLIDVGSGLGGIDVLIRRHYAQTDDMVRVHLLDGIADPAQMHLHRETFNDMARALEFQVANGLERQMFTAWGPQVRTFGDVRFDLVVSFGSWCFHYPPAQYLRQIHRALAPGAVVIVDVRTNKPEWMKTLEAAFEPVTMVELKPKFSRCVFKVRPA